MNNQENHSHTVFQPLITDSRESESSVNCIKDSLWSIIQKQQAHFCFLSSHDWSQTSQWHFFSRKYSYPWRRRWRQGSSGHCHSGCTSRSCSQCRVVNLGFVKRQFLSDLDSLGSFNSSAIFMVPLSSHIYMNHRSGLYLNIYIW